MAWTQHRVFAELLCLSLSLSIHSRLYLCFPFLTILILVATLFGTTTHPQPRNLLGLRPCPYIDAMSERELVSLLYRDNLKVKHANKSRFIEEISKKEGVKQTTIALSSPPAIAPAAKDPSLSWKKMLVQHLLKVWPCLVCQISLLVWDLVCTTTYNPWTQRVHACGVLFGKSDRALKGPDLGQFPWLKAVPGSV